MTAGAAEADAATGSPPPRRSPVWWAYATLRTAGCWVLLSLLTIGCAGPYLIAARLAPEGRVTRAIERFWVWFILRGSNVRLSAEGLEHAAPGRSYIVMANHASMYDIPVLHYLLGRDRDLRWVGKHELLRVPVFGRIFAASRHVAIDRDDRARSIAALRDAAAASAEGMSFVVMPEGTRGSSDRLLPFKKGGFHLAIDTALPILPVGILGSERLMRKGAWWILPGAISVRIRPAIPTASLTKARLEELLQRVRGQIHAALGEPTMEGERSPR